MKTNRRYLALIAATVGLVFASQASLAHHAFAAEYDADKALDETGVVTKARWVNPHSRLEFDVKNPDGSVTNWSVELAAPNALSNQGISKADFSPGAVVHVKGFLSKNGGPFGYAASITLADGRTFRTGGAPDAAGAAGVAPAAGN